MTKPCAKTIAPRRSRLKRPNPVGYPALSLVVSGVRYRVEPIEAGERRGWYLRVPGSPRRLTVWEHSWGRVLCTCGRPRSDPSSPCPHVAAVLHAYLL